MRLMSSMCAALALTGCLFGDEGGFVDGDFDGNFIECVVDEDCFTPDEVCNQLTGLCEPVVAEGEGEPECTLSGFAEPSGDGALTIDDAVLDVDADNLAACAIAADARIASFFVNGAFNADMSGNEVRFSVDGGPPRACVGRPAASGGLVLCPVCFAAPPADMAIQFEDDDGALSSATCVDTDGQVQGGVCELDGFDDPAGSGGLTISDAFLDPDADNIAGCVAGTDAFFMSFLFDGAFVADMSGNEVQWSEDGGPPQFCSSFPVAVENIVVCPLCFVTPPVDMAVQLEDDNGELSNATCVDTSGA